MAKRHLIGLALACALPLAAGATWVAPASAQQQQDDLARVGAYIRAVQTFTANFTQTDRNGQVLTGKLTLKQPGKIRFQYQDGVPLLIIGDGRALIMIDYEVRQVQRWPIRNSPLGALLDPTRDIGRYGKVVPSGDPSVVMVEAKDPKRPEYGVITLVFKRRADAPSGLEMYGWVALDSQNNRTTVRLSNPVYNAPVADTAFRWRDPRPSMRPGGG